MPLENHTIYSFYVNLDGGCEFYGKLIEILCGKAFPVTLF